MLDPKIITNIIIIMIKKMINNGKEKITIMKMITVMIPIIIIAINGM